MTKRKLPNSDYRDHLRTTGSALKNWFVAASYDALSVGALWLIGLLIIGIPLAPLWAVIGAAMQFVPNVGALLALIGPAAVAFFSSAVNDNWSQFLYVLVLYAIIAVVDGLVLQPYFMRRTAKVPVWASILVPLVAGILLPFWGILLAAPLLVVYYTFKHKREQERLAREPQALPPESRIG